jgi:8-oxo-dGTP pyrophosphatase MutT (NUDIX family)
LQRAKNEKVLPNMWELPSGKKEFSESCKDCLKREIKEETGLRKIKVIMPFSLTEFSQKIKILD